MAIGIARFRQHKSVEPYVIASSVSIKIMGSILVLATTLYSCSFHPKHFTPMAISFITYTMAINVVTGVVQMLVMDHPSASVVRYKNEVLNKLIQVDVLACVCIGCGWMMFPDWILHRQVKVQLTASHLWIGRCMGALFVSTFYGSFSAATFSYSEDRRTLCILRAIMCGGISTAQLWSQIAYHQWWNSGHWVGISLFGVWTTVVLFINRKMKKGDWH